MLADDSVHNTASPEDGSSIFTALGDIGLRLQPSTGPVETVVIDHVERPAGDAGGEVPQAKDVPAQALATVSKQADMAVRPPTVLLGGDRSSPEQDMVWHDFPSGTRELLRQ